MGPLAPPHSLVDNFPTQIKSEEKSCPPDCSGAPPPPLLLLLHNLFNSIILGGSLEIISTPKNHPPCMSGTLFVHTYIHTLERKLKHTIVVSNWPGQTGVGPSDLPRFVWMRHTFTSRSHPRMPCRSDVGTA